MSNENKADATITAEWTADTIALYRKRGVKIGNNVGIWGGIDNVKPRIVTIGNDVIIGTHTWFITHCPIKFYKDIDVKTVVGNNVYIGWGCLILPGVKIGDNVVIGAGSVVTKDIPSNVIAGGNPCRVIRSITKKEALRILLLTRQRKEANGQEPIWEGEEK